MRKTKLILPLLAIVFALLSAFATAPVAQRAWYDSNGLGEAGGMEGDITTPDVTVPVPPTCNTVATTFLCKIHDGITNRNAFTTQAYAEQNGGQPNAGVLKYD